MTLGAACSTWAGPVGQNAAAPVIRNAAVDPCIEFAQAAFDASMGANTFAREPYYAFDFSPNLPVPEPGAYVLMLAGIGVVALS